MKNINITRKEAINTIINNIQRGYYIPMVSLGNGGAGYDLLHSEANIEALNAELNDTERYNFRVVPESEIAEDFKENNDLDCYDVCVEFASTIGDNREQYLLWDD